jgi:membrane protease YdiL (CAAX protease family)
MIIPESHKKLPGLAEPTLAFLIASITILLAQKLLPFHYTGIAVASVLLWFPALLIFLNRTNSEQSGVSKFTRSDLGYGISVSIPILIIYRLFLDYQGFVVVNSLYKMSLSEWLTIFSYFLLEAGTVAIPEEFFFRGYIQGVIYDKTKFSWVFSIFYSATLFAMLHVATTGNFNRLIVFLPALLFGWMRYKTGNIAASVVCHSLCNVTHYLFTGQLTL